MLINYTDTQIIETKRLVLRRFETSDIPSVLENWLGDPLVQHDYGEKACTSIVEAERVINNWIGRYGDLEFYRWSIILKENGESIGQIAYYLVDSKNHKVDVEYCIGQSYWGNGYAPEALRAVIDYGLEQMQLNRVQGFHRRKNASSGRVLEKAGMKYEGTLRHFLAHDGEFDDCMIYSIIRTDWEGPLI